MSVTFLKPDTTPQLFPLNDEVGQSFVGGRSLKELQEDLWSELTCYENTWISAADYLEFMETGATRIISKSGELLAWRGKGGGTEVVSEGDSFLIRYAWDLLEVNAQSLSNFTANRIDGVVHSAVHVDGALIVGAGTKVLPGVYVEGTVFIGENCKIGPNCYLRGSTSIGNNCHVGQSVEVKNSILGHGTSVGHLSYVGDSILGEKVNFGAGTTTSNLRHDNGNHRSMIEGELIDTGRRKFGTVIGSGVHTGIHTAIYPGRKIKAGGTTLPNETVTTDII